jgi:hypothetical protein
MIGSSLSGGMCILILRTHITVYISTSDLNSIPGINQSRALKQSNTGNQTNVALLPLLVFIHAARQAAKNVAAKNERDVDDATDETSKLVGGGDSRSCMWNVGLLYILFIFLLLFRRCIASRKEVVYSSV